MSIDTTSTSFKCVFIPADTAKPMEEHTVEIKDGENLSAMIDYVKQHISLSEQARKAGLTREQLRQERAVVGQQLSSELKKNPQLSHIVLTDDLIDRIYLANAVDSVILHPNCIASNFVGINMYVDDQGMSKKLTRNTRATNICLTVGINTEVLGDCFLAKVVDDDDHFSRPDFTLADLHNQEWVTVARALNTSKIAKSTPHESAMKTLGLKPQVSQIPAKEAPESANQQVAIEQTPEQLKAQAQQQSTQQGIPGEVTKAYSQGNKPLRDRSQLCGQGHLNCEEKAPLRCSRCKTTLYCSVAHQKSDWKRHKNDCVPAPAAPAAK